MAMFSLYLMLSKEDPLDSHKRHKVSPGLELLVTAADGVCQAVLGQSVSEDDLSVLTEF